jgi:chemotaxis protein CheD
VQAKTETPQRVERFTRPGVERFDRPARPGVERFDRPARPGVERFDTALTRRRRTETTSD